MKAPTLSSYWDIEGALCSAVVLGLQDHGLAALEMLRSQVAEGPRCEVNVQLIAETGRSALDPALREFRSEYRCGLVVDVRTPVDQYDVHRELRGRVRSLLAMPLGRALMNDRLPYARVDEIASESTLNLADYNSDGQEELSAQITFTVHLSLIEGAYPEE